MSTAEVVAAGVTKYPVDIEIAAPPKERNRLTVAFRLVLAIPHLLLVGGPITMGAFWSWSSDGNLTWGSGGAFGVLAGIAALISWFAIVFTGRQVAGLEDLCAFYLRWRVRAVAYTAMFTDEYPPFSDAAYPAGLVLDRPSEARDRLTVAFRLILALPHIFLMCLLGMAWGLTSVIAWFAILFTGHYPEGLYQFGLGVFRWNVRVDAYLLLLTDEYPPFSFV